MEIWQLFNEDIQLSSNAQIRLVDGEQESIQRILRRLLTPVEGYIWHVTYGAGLPTFIGQNLSPALERQIKGLIKTQMFLEATVERNPEPKITLSTDGNNLNCDIVYVYKPSGQIYTLSFTVSE